jgi:hypothetical protein
MHDPRTLVDACLFALFIIVIFVRTSYQRVDVFSRDPDSLKLEIDELAAAAMQRDDRPEHRRNRGRAYLRQPQPE